ncbi:poly(A)-specific ribonuclease [Acrasis kona]|uniref:Poly(A)-specific ribonuclease n=1 Tax=Acrasis kona TaxID=1008807 RepID=A0AAW2Z1V8_9EUKA
MDGIEEQKLIKSEESRRSRQAAPVENKIQLSTLRPDVIEFIRKAQSDVRNWYTTTVEHFDIEVSNAFTRKLLYENLGDIFPGKISFRTIHNPRTVFRVSRIAEENKDQEVHNVVQSQIGFRRIIKLLTQLRVPIIGHNMLLDIVHVYHKFIAPLPDTLDEFCDQLMKTFPGGIIDTKHMARTDKLITQKLFVDTGLGQLLESTSSAEFNEGLTFPQHAETFNQPREHEAAFDSIVTGYIYIRMSHYFGKNQHNVDYTTIGQLDHLTQAINTDRMCILITGLSEQIQNSDITPLFKDYGSAPCNIKWIDDKSAFVRLRVATREQLEQIAEHVKKGSKSGVEFKKSVAALGCTVTMFDEADRNGIIDCMLNGKEVPVKKRSRSSNVSLDISREMSPRKKARRSFTRPSEVQSIKEDTGYNLCTIL